MIVMASKNKKWLVSQVESEQRRLEGGGVLKRGLGDVALLTAFLAKV
jgi:hypothetical protein